MGLLRKLFGAKLADIEGKIPAPDIRRVAPRVQLMPLHHVGFVAEGEISKRLAAEKAEALKLGIANLSLSGIGFIKESVRAWPELGTEIAGNLVIGSQEIPVRAKLVHISGRVAGCAFQGELGSLQQMVLQHFRVEHAALGMVEAPADVLQVEPEGTPHWFHGKNNCELYYLTRTEDQALIRLQLSFFANYVESTVQGPVRFGTVIEDDAFDKPRHKTSALVKWEETPPPDMIEAIVRFLGNIQGLPPRIREQIASLIRWNERHKSLP